MIMELKNYGINILHIYSCRHGWHDNELNQKLDVL